MLFWRGGLWPQARGVLLPSTEKLWVGDLQTGILGCGQGQQAGPGLCPATGSQALQGHGQVHSACCLLPERLVIRAGPKEEPTFCFLPLYSCLQ